MNYSFNNCVGEFLGEEKESNEDHTSDHLVHNTVYPNPIH